MRIQHFDRRGVERALEFLREEIMAEVGVDASSLHDGYDKLTPGWNDVLVSPAAMKLPAANKPTEGTFKTNLEAWEFDIGGSEYIHIEGLQLPHSYVYGTDLHFHVHFSPKTAIADGETVMWTLTYTVSPVWGLFPAEDTVTCTFTNNADMRAAISSVDPAAISGTSIVADTHLMATEAIIDGSGLGLSSILMGRLERSTSGTYSGNVYLLSSDAHIQIERLGSRYEYKG